MRLIDANEIRIKPEYMHDKGIEKMTLEEAIEHCLEVAEQVEKFKRVKAATYEDCRCADEHRQLAEWLKELKMWREGRLTTEDEE